MNNLFRVLLGFILACLAAALVKVLFAYPPTDLANMTSDEVVDKLLLTFPIATHMGLFASVMALIAIAFSEVRSMREWIYYAFGGIIISLLGFWAQLSSEPVGQTWSVQSNSYPLLTFIVSGFAGGIVYWLYAGRNAGDEPQRVVKPMSGQAAVNRNGGAHNNNKPVRKT
jgi:uncharacterized membrane protein YozB (DUF420 family)